MGRLFLTPGERAALDIIRQNSKPPERIITSAEQDELIPEEAKPVVPPVVTVHGYVKRSDGRGTIWVNGRPVQEKSANQDVEVGRLQNSGNDVQIKLPGTGQTVKLKAGQSYDPGSGRIGALREIAPLTVTIPPEPPADVKAAAKKNGDKSSVPPAMQGVAEDKAMPASPPVIAPPPPR